MKKNYENPIIEVLELEVVETSDGSVVTQPGYDGDGSWPNDWGM